MSLSFQHCFVVILNYNYYGVCMSFLTQISYLQIMDDQNIEERYDESASNKSCDDDDDDDMSDVQVEEEYIEVVGSDQDEEDNNVIEESSKYNSGSTDQHPVHDATQNMQCRSPETEDPGKQAVCCQDKLADNIEVTFSADVFENLEESISEEFTETSTEVISTSDGGGDGNINILLFKLFK